MSQFASALHRRRLLLQERLASGVAFDPMSPRHQADPYRAYRRLQSRSPVHWSRLLNAWLLSRHADVDAVLRDSRFSSDPRNVAGYEALPDERAPNLLGLDPPDHTRLRHLVADEFAAGRIAEARPRLETLVAALLDAVDASRPFDLMAALAVPLPVTVICSLLALPEDDHGRIKAWSAAIADGTQPRADVQARTAAYEAHAALEAYFATIIEERRGGAGRDLISQLVHAEGRPDGLTHAELLTMLPFLLVAGHETTTNLITNSVLSLLRHPVQWDYLCAHPEAIPDALDELARFETPVQVDARIALTDITLRGQQLRGGDQVLLLLGAANRDPEVFSRPEVLDVTRPASAQLSFGRGIHYCLGAPLARLELQLVIEQLTARFPRLTLAEPPRFRPHSVFRGVESLLVREASRAVALS